MAKGTELVPGIGQPLHLLYFSQLQRYASIPVDCLQGSHHHTQSTSQCIRTDWMHICCCPAFMHQQVKTDPPCLPEPGEEEHQTVQGLDIMLTNDGRYPKRHTTFFQQMQTVQSFSHLPAQMLVDVRGTVQTYAHLDLLIPEKMDKILGESRSIGLNANGTGPLPATRPLYRVFDQLRH